MEIGELMPDGYRLNEIASELGVTPSWVSARLDELRSEIVLQTGGFLPLTDTEYAALKASISEYGQQVPVLVGSTGLLDGKHRILALRELGISEVLVEFVTDTNANTERSISRTVNAARRHLNRAQKEALVRAELEHNWQRSSRQIGLDCGCSVGFVESIRTLVRNERETMQPEAAAQDEPELLLIDNSPAPRSVSEAVHAATVPREQEMRVDAAGKRRPAYVRKTKTPKPYADREGKQLAILTCAHGQRHSLRRSFSKPYELIPLDE